MTHLSTKKKWEIIFLSKHHLGPKLNNLAISREIGCDVKVVRFWLKRYEETGDVEEFKSSGKPRATTVKEDKVILSLHEAHPQHSSFTLHKVLKKKNIQVSSRTITRRLHEVGKKFLPPISKPLLSKKHRKKRLTWAKENQDRDWNSVIFTDKTTFQLFYHKRRYWQYPGQRLVVETVKHPVKVHVWGCLSSKGFGRLYIFQKNLDANLLCKIYQKALLSSIETLVEGEWVLQEDNDPKHTSKKAQQWKEEHDIKRMTWPAQSPDQNCIENLWRVMKYKVAASNPQTVKELVTSIKKVWSNLPLELAQNLVNSMSNRVNAVIEANGDYTLY